MNEFESDNWGGPPPAGAPAGATTAGQAYMAQRGYHGGSQWVLLGVLAWGVGSTALNTGLFALAASYLQQESDVEVVSKPGEGEGGQARERAAAPRLRPGAWGAGPRR